MTIEELKDSGAIYFEKITEGMQQYDNQIVRMNEYQAVDKFTELWEACGCKNVYVDFYYFTLPQEAREQIDSVLAYQEREYVHQMEHKEGHLSTRQPRYRCVPGKSSSHPASLYSFEDEKHYTPGDG